VLLREWRPVMPNVRPYKVGDRKYSSDHGWFFICWDNRIYRFHIALGRLSVAFEAKG